MTCAANGSSGHRVYQFRHRLIDTKHNRRQDRLAHLSKKHFLHNVVVHEDKHTYLC